MSRLAATAAVSAVALLAGTATSYASLSTRPWSIPAEDVGVVACHVSWNSWTRQPSLARSTQNPCRGVHRVSVDAKGRIVLRHTFDPVIGIEVTPNETAIGRGLTAGASGGGSKTDLTVHDARVGRTLHLASGSEASRMGSGAGFWVKITHDGR